MHRHVSKVSLGNKFDDHKMIVRGRNHTGTAEPPNRATFSKRARPQQLRSGAPGTRPPLQGDHNGDASALPRAPRATFSLLCGVTRARNIARISPTYVRTSVFTVVASLEIKERGWSD